MAESEEELKSLLMKVDEKSKNAGLNLSIHNMKIMASSPITLQQVDGNEVMTNDKMETVTDFILFSWAQKSMYMVTVAMKLKDTCSLEEKL